MDTRRHGSWGHLRSLSQVPRILDTTFHLSTSYDVHSYHPNPDSYCFLSKYFKSLQILPISILASLQCILHSRPSSLLKMDKNLSPSLKYAKTNHIFLFYLNSVLSSCPARLWGYPVLITIGFIPPLPQGSVMVLGPRALPKYPQLWAPTVAMEILPELQVQGIYCLQAMLGHTELWAQSPEPSSERQHVPSLSEVLRLPQGHCHRVVHLFLLSLGCTHLDLDPGWEIPLMIFPVLCPSESPKHPAFIIVRRCCFQAISALVYTSGPRTGKLKAQLPA